MVQQASPASAARLGPVSNPPLSAAAGCELRCWAPPWTLSDLTPLCFSPSYVLPLSFIRAGTNDVSRCNVKKMKKEMVPSFLKLNAPFRNSVTPSLWLL